MNILVPDEWLREYLKTDATPKKLKECLSLSGPSIERINKEDKDIVYDIEVTTNRSDSMSIMGIAREAGTILPRFGIRAEVVGDPYAYDIKSSTKKYEHLSKDALAITTEESLNPRFTAIVLDVTVKKSPEWLSRRLALVGVRSINTVVDATNYIMHAFGQPVHAFDYDRIGKRKGVPTMIVRESKKGEQVTTLDGKPHVLPGTDIVIEDGEGKLIDLCGIMGGENSSITENTKRIVLFMQTYDPVRIRKTSMRLAARSEASSLFEKGLDPELVLPCMELGIKLLQEISNGNPVSSLYDLYPSPYKKPTVSVKKDKVTTYIGKEIPDREIKEILESLGLHTTIDKTTIHVQVPSFRRDISIGEDIIEEIARIYGYHTIETKLPDTEPPITYRDPELDWEQSIKTRLRDWGYTELFTYSMISEELMNIFSWDTKKAYKISNPLSSDWEYLRPTLWPSMLSTLKQNLSVRPDLKLFELSMEYQYRQNNLPNETPILIVAWTGHAFLEAKGLAETIFSLFGIDLPGNPSQEFIDSMHDWNDSTYEWFGEYGSASEVKKSLLERLGIFVPVTILCLDFAMLVQHAKPTRTYRPLARFPAVIEDLSFTVPDHMPIGPLLSKLKEAHLLIDRIELIDMYKSSRTIRVAYRSSTKNLTSEEVAPIRAKLISLAQEKFGAILRG